MKSLLSGVLLSLFLAACASLPDDLEKPRITLSAVALKSVSLFEQRFNLALNLQNPNNRDLRLQGLDLEVELNGQPFASVVSNQALTLPRLGNATMTVEATTRLSSWLNQMRHLQRGGSRHFRYRLKGSVYGGALGINIPVEEQGEVNFDDFAAPPGDPRDTAPLPSLPPSQPTTLPNAI